MTMEMELGYDDDIVSLPDWLGASTLTISEIGAIFCVACGETDAGGYPEAWKARMDSKEVVDAMKSLKDRGVIKVSELPDGGISVKIDLDVVAPQ